MTTSPRRILFLDIDGVLNSVAWVKARGPRKPGSTLWWHGDIDPAAVLLLDRIVREAGCEIVLSSTWRLIWQLETVSDLLTSLGLSKRLIGKTPEWHTRPEGFIVGVYPTRGLEIQAWLDAQPERPASIAIVDDDSDMGELLPWLVQTSAEHGLQPEHLARILDTFGRPAPNPSGLGRPETGSPAPTGEPRTAGGGHARREPSGSVAGNVAEPQLGPGGSPVPEHPDHPLDAAADAPQNGRS